MSTRDDRSSKPPARGARSSDAAAVTAADGLALVALLVLGQILLYGLAVAVGVAGGEGEQGTRGVQIAIMVAILGGCLGWLAARGRLRGALRPGGAPGWRDVVLGVGGGVAGFVVLLFALGLVLERLGVDPPEQQTIEDAVTGGSEAVLAVLLAVGIAPVLEELVFRGALYLGLRDRLRPWPAALLSAGIFAGVHVEVVTSAPVFLVQLFVLGLLFAWLLERTGNLLAPVVAHLVFNGISIALAMTGPGAGGDAAGAALRAWG